MDHLRRELTARHNIDEVRLRPGGNATGFSLLEEVAQRLTQERKRIFLVGGVDSFIDVDTIDWLEERNLLRTGTNKWGITPGEAAAFCLLTGPALARRVERPAYATLVAAATSHESALPGSEGVCTGGALSQACAAVLSREPAERAATIICDLNGERNRADEFGFMLARLGGRLRDPIVQMTPADCWGHVGAATVPLFMTLAARSTRKIATYSDGTLLCAASEGGLRGAARVVAQP